MTTKLTDKTVRQANCPAGKDQIKIYDGQFPGFGIRVTAAGTRSFILNYTVDGRERLVTIGRYPAWSVAAARQEAAKFRRMADCGEDPKPKIGSAKTVGDLWNRYREDRLPKKAEATARNEISMWTRFILPRLGHRQLRSIEAADIDQLHCDISKTTPVQANRCIASLRHAFNLAVRWKLIDRNPAAGVRVNAEVPRERYLTDDEQRRFLQALRAKRVTSSTLAIEFLMLTGARKGETLKARWEEFDLDEGVWFKPSTHTKQRRSHRVPLSAGALNVLEAARNLQTGDCVFPGSTGEPLKDIKKTFGAVCDEAGIADLRIHDLRHSFASTAINAGAPLQVIGALLGHTQLATTQRYAHLMDETLRDAANRVGAKFSE